MYENAVDAAYLARGMAIRTCKKVTNLQESYGLCTNFVLDATWRVFYGARTAQGKFSLDDRYSNEEQEKIAKELDEATKEKEEVEVAGACKWVEIRNGDCIQDGECCSEWGYCGTGRAYCGSRLL